MMLNLNFLKAIDTANAELRARNEHRLREAKEKMGAKYLLHPDNAMSKEKYAKIVKVNGQ